MKKILLLAILMLSMAVISNAQMDSKANAMNLVRQNAAELKLSSTDLNDLIISSTYQIRGTDVTMVYLQQSFKGVQVYNQMKTLAFKGGKIVSNAGVFLPSMEKLTKSVSELPTISAVSAINTAYIEAKVIAKEPAVPISITENGKKMTFGKLGVSLENIVTELMWMPDDNGIYHLAWQVFIAPQNSSDYWLIRIDAHTGSYLNKQNLTVTCSWDKNEHSIEQHLAENHNKQSVVNNQNYVIRKNETTKKWEFKPFVVNTASYKVVKYPAESPQHPGGTPSVHVDPWTMAPGNATSLKWNSDPTDYSITRGNNVWAYADRSNNNNPASNPAGVSTTALPNLTFEYTYDFTKSPTDPTSDNQQAAIVNLFYANNLIHDMAYQYGFDEVAGNFQNDNQGRGGLGNDYVQAEAQDGGGTNNANFATPVDGSKPRMQMYLWNMTNPNRDGDMDNGVIMHEYGHGISNRFTGGPGNTSCLGNQEQGGEGWSDYMSLMMGTNWATATVNDGPLKRGIGTYVLGQPITGTGIRAQPYSTDMSIFSLTYANLPSQVVPHGVGTVWCGMIWEMTWEIIKQDNAIETNFMNPSGPVLSWKGNAAAMKLVMEGMRLQPCSPGFVDARNAILQADQLFFNGRYKCAIWKAFAKRGLGRNASQGSSNSISDGTADFSVDSGSFSLNPSVATAPESSTITYTNAVVSGECSAMSNYVLRDTLPTSVTWVSGGVYNPADRVVTFSPINLPINSSQNFNVTVSVNAGTYFAPVQHINDPVTTIAPNWTAISTTANVWSVSTVASHSAPNSFFTPNAAQVSDQILTTTSSFTLSNATSAFHSLSFWHRYITESGYDGCVVEISTDGGTTWSDLGQYMSGATYNGTISSSFSNPLAGRRAFTGNVGASFVKTTINLSAFKGQTVKIRFRLGSDTSVGATGWYVDDILLESGPFVYTKAGLYDATNARTAYRDTLTPITAGGPCVNPAITTHPASVVRCSVAGNAVFSVAATGTNLVYQWQLSTDNGATWNDITGANTATYTITNPTTALNNNLYRCSVTGDCGSPAVSNAGSIYVSPVLTHSSVTASPNSGCAPGATTITGTVNGGTTNLNGLIGASGLINVAIPDNNAAGYNTTIKLPSLTVQQAANLKLRLNLTHSWAGDLIVKLTSPCGVTYAFDRIGYPATSAGNSMNFNGTYLFDLNAATVLPETDAGTNVDITQGSYKPSDANGAAHNWAGLTFPCSTSGDWILNISDNAAADIGTLQEWALLLGGNYTHTLTGPGTIVQNAPSGPNNSNASFGVTAIPNGPQTYTLTSTDALGCSVSSQVTVNFTAGVVINTQPVNASICSSTNATFTVVEGAGSTPTYQWQVSTTGAGGPWTNLSNAAPYSGVNTNTLTITSAPLALNGNYYRCVLSNTCGTTNSNAALLTVNGAPTVTCPSNITVNSAAGTCGAVVNYPPATATGSPVPTITYSQASGTNFPVGTTTVTVTATNTCGVATCTFTVTVLDNQAPTITCPANIVRNTDAGVCTATFAPANPVTADNCGVTLLTWTMSGATTGSSPVSGVNNLGTKTFNTGVTTVSYTVKDAAGNTANCSFTVTVTDGAVPVVTAQPQNKNTCIGSNATFSVTATNAVSYQWQSWNGTAWVNITGANAATYTVTNAALAMNTNSYRVQVIGVCTTTTSNLATLYVNSLPIVSIATSHPPVLLPTQNVTLTAVVSPTGGAYQWFKDGVAISGATSQSLSGLTVSDAGTYKVRYTDPNGCTNTSADLIVSAMSSDLLYIYPNPNNGQFHIRFYNMANETATIKIYAYNGALVYNKPFTTTLPYSDMSVDLGGRVANGIYVVEVRSSTGRL
ncbi:MAG: M36 family metallopeptidase, partial [Bacteroidetes bacterium]|nr:M36 family metallopeptidase [Bacteroidota bacterium]